MDNPSLISCSASSTVIPALENLGYDPENCIHEWWEEKGMIYASYPPCIKQQCRLCGKVEFHRDEIYLPQGPRWERVPDNG